MFDFCLRKFQIPLISISKSEKVVDESTGHWASMEKHRLNDLKHEFKGWRGSHERSCVLHDVFLI